MLKTMIYIKWVLASAFVMNKGQRQVFGWTELQGQPHKQRSPRMSDCLVTNVPHLLTLPKCGPAIFWEVVVFWSTTQSRVHKWEEIHKVATLRQWISPLYRGWKYITVHWKQNSQNKTLKNPDISPRTTPYLMHTTNYSHPHDISEQDPFKEHNLGNMQALPPILSISPDKKSL